METSIACRGSMLGSNHFSPTQFDVSSLPWISTVTSTIILLLTPFFILRGRQFRSEESYH